MARGLAAHSGHDEQTALEGLARWAGSVGGELNGSALLWPDRFGTTPQSGRVLSSADPDHALDREERAIGRSRTRR
jgi:hypothetical protein